MDGYKIKKTLLDPFIPHLSTKIEMNKVIILIVARLF